MKKVEEICVEGSTTIHDPRAGHHSGPDVRPKRKEDSAARIHSHGFGDDRVGAKLGTTLCLRCGAQDAKSCRDADSDQAGLFTRAFHRATV